MRVVNAHLAADPALDPSRFGLWLRERMDERGYGVRQLSELAGVDHATISRLLSGRREPLLATADKLARALDAELVLGREAA